MSRTKYAVGMSLAVLAAAVSVSVSRASAGPTDNTLPQVSRISFEPGVTEIGQNARVGAVIQGRFLPDSLGTTASLTVAFSSGSSADTTIAFNVLGWDTNRIFGVLTAQATTTLGDKTVQVTQAGATGTCTSCFFVGFTPAVTSVAGSPISVDTGGTLSLTGSRFEPNVTVTLTPQGIPPITKTVASPDSTHISASFTSAELSGAQLGTASLSVTNPGSGRSASAVPTVSLEGTAPSLSSVTGETTLGQGATGRVITVAGSNFYKGVAVSFSNSGISASATMNSATSLTLTVSVAGDATPGNANLTVTNGDGKAATFTNAVTVIPKATVNWPTPQSFPIPQGAVGFPITVPGAGFRSDTAVTLPDAGGTATVQNVKAQNGGTQLYFEINVAESAANGSQFTIQVANPGGATPSSCSKCVTVTPGPKPTSATPSTGMRGTSLTVAVNGSGFLPANQNGIGFPLIQFSGSGITQTSPVAYAPNKLTVTIQIDANATTGSRDVIVVNPDGGRGTCGSCFSVQ